jgi:hypothetical protein
MDTKLAAINPYLARAVLTSAAVFATAVTLLAALTGENLLFVGTAFGVMAGGYAMQVLRTPRLEFNEAGAERVTVDA